MNESPDRRLWSTTPRRLSEFVGALLETAVPAVTVRDLQIGFRDHRFYPARDLPQFCIAQPPDVFFSYHSAQNFVDLQQIVWQATDFAAKKVKLDRPEVSDEELEPLIQDGIRLWVDFMFIDQSARDLREELEVLPQLVQGARAHFVVGTRPLMRAWCCYELALFNQDLAQSDTPDMPWMHGAKLRSYIAPTRSFYIGWDQTETSEVEDKRFIGERISSTFPGGFDGFNEVMAQANSVAILPIAEGTEWSTPAADEQLRVAAESWYARWLASR